MLGLVPTIAINQFCEHLAARNTGAALALIAQLAGEGAGFRQFNQQVIQRLRTMLVEHSATVDRNAAWDTPRLLAAIRTLAAIDFSNRLSALPQLLVELAAVEICTRSAPAPSVSQGLPVAVQVPTDAAAPASAPPRPQPTYTRPAAPPVRSSGNGGSNFRRGAPQASAPPPARPATGYTPARDAPPDDDDFERTPGVMPNVAPEQRRLWERGIGLLRQKNPRAQGLCNSTRFAGFQDGALQLVPNHSFVRDQLSDPKFREIVEQVMAEVFGQPVTLRFLSASEVPADGAKATVPAKPADPALPDVASNPTVLAALDVFGATIKEVIPPGSPAPRDGHSR
jgi:hypothetical protein